MTITIKAGGLSRQLVRPFLAPYEFVHQAGSGGEHLRISFKGSDAPNRLCMPADYASGKLYSWNQKNSRVYGSQWATITNINCSVAMTRLISGSSAGFHYLSYGGLQTEIEGIYGANTNWSKDTVNHKYSYEFFLDNDLEETNPTVIYDDDESFWSTYVWGSGSIGISLSEETTIKSKGASSLKMQVGAGASVFVGCQHDYGSGQDWSGKEYICLYLYGSNTGKTVRIRIFDSGGSDNLGIDIVENWSGWKRLVIPFKTMTETGTCDLNAIQWVRLYYTNAAGTETLYLDRTVIDVGQLMKVESYLPDRLSDGQSVKLYAYDGAAYQQFAAWDAEDDSTAETVTAANLKFLSGVSALGIWSDLASGLGLFIKGERGQAATAAYGSQSLTFGNYYGCLKRIGFGIKAPPDDGQDASTAGISQCRLKLEVYYADAGDPAGFSGQATYEFANSTDTYYGLQNWNEPWLAVFDTTLKRAFYFVFSARATGLKICADENEKVHWIEATLTAGTRVYAGELYHANMSIDSDADEAPDFLDAPNGIPNLAGGMAVW